MVVAVAGDGGARRERIGEWIGRDPVTAAVGAVVAKRLADIAIAAHDPERVLWQPYGGSCLAADPAVSLHRIEQCLSAVEVDRQRGNIGLRLPGHVLSSEQNCSQ